MKEIFKLTFGVLLIGMTMISEVHAQLYPVDVNAVLIPPHSLNLPDYGLEKSQDLMINITLNDPIEPFWDVRFRLTVSNNGVEILKTNPSFVPAPFRLNQYATVTLSGFELSEYLKFENLISINGYQHTGVLPEGLNSICLEVLDYNRQDVVLSSKICASGYAILNDPPFPQLPLCGSDVDYQDAQNIMFTWLPMHLGSPNPVSGVEYEFTIVKVEPGYNEFEAMEAASPLYREVTPNTSIVVQDPILEGGYTYAWRVRATDSFGGKVENLFKNDGYSTVCTFNYQEQEVVDFTALYEENASTECSASCQADIPTNAEIRMDLAIDDLVKVGKFYMNVTKINGASGGFYSGKGYIFIPFLLSNMNVSFSDMTVNTDGEFFSGEIVTDIDSDLLGDNYTDTDGAMSINADEIASIDGYIKDNNRQTSQSDQGSSLGLPFAIDNTIGGVTNNLIITGISFEPDIAYLNAVMSFESTSGESIAFGGKGICFHPYGIGGGTAQIYLAEDFSLGDYSDFDLTFKASGPDNSGSYIAFDCTGFLELNIEGEYEFPEDMLVAADGTGPVTANFNINTIEWGQFIADLEMNEFEVKGVDGYTFTVDQAYLDYSDVANPENAEFPEGYDNTGDDWKGFYLSTLSLSLPDDLSQASGDISIGTQNVIIDHSGVSANIFTAGVLDLQSGRLGEWAFSIDTVQINIESNTLVDGSLLGQIHVPILKEDNALNYSALMTKNEDNIDLLFAINTEEDVSVSMWAAEMSLASTSVIAISKTNDGFNPYAELNGDLSLAMEIQEGNAFEIEALAFEGLKINHPDEDQRIAVDAFSLFGGGNSDDELDNSYEADNSEEQESLSGFPISISNVAFEEGEEDEAAINFDLNLNLTGDDLGVAGTANVIVTGAYNAAGAPFNAWTFDGVELSAIDVEADIAAGSITGSLEIYKGDDTYGSGFKGLLNAQFTGIGEVDALAQFGKVKGFRYFFVDAMLLSQTPFVDILGVGLYGFGGGMYHHMNRDDTDPAMNLEANTLYAEPSELGASLSGIRYNPDKSTLLGLKAALTMGIAPGSSFSADAYFEASFGLTNNVPMVRSIGFGGTAYMMSPGSILDREDSKVIGKFDANLDLSEPSDPVFTATASVDLDTEVITGSGNAAMKLSKKESYMWIGTPNNPVSIGVKGLGNFDMYADMGDRVPAMPNVSDLVPNYSGTTINQRPKDLGGTKIIFGAKYAMPKKSFTYGSFYASAQFGIGFDAYLRQVSAADCGAASGAIGIDSWYLSGQAYAYGTGNIGLKVKTWFYKGNVNLLNLSASMVMQAELPNPTWVSGDVNVKYKVLGGAIKGSVKYNFEVGERCTFEENPISGIKVIADISPKNGEKNVNCFASPIAVTNLPINKAMVVEQLESDGDVIAYEYVPYVSSTSMTGGKRSYRIAIEENGDLIVMDQQTLLDEYTWYNVSMTVKWKKRKKGSSKWEYLDQTETRDFKFKTGKKPDFIPEDAVSYANPMPNRRNVYDQRLTNKWRIWLETEGWGYLFSDSDYKYIMKATNMESGSSIERPVGYSDHPYFRTGMVGFGTNNSVAFNRWLNAQNGAMIMGQVIGKYKTSASDASISTTTTNKATGVDADTKSLSGNRVKASAEEDKLIYKWYFRMSDFNNPQDKLNAYNRNRESEWTYTTNWMTGRKGYSADGGLKGSEERFDKWDLKSNSYKIGRYTIDKPAIITQHRLNYDAAGSRAKSAMDRWWWMKEQSDFYSYRSSARRSRWFDNDFWRTGDFWRTVSNSAFSFNKWTMFGGSSRYTYWFCNYCKSELTDAEKSSGNADQGYTKWGWTSIRFVDKTEEMIAYRYMVLAYHRRLLKDDNRWEWINKTYRGGWHNGGSWDKSVWMMGVTNWDAGASYKIHYLTTK